MLWEDNGYEGVFQVSKDTGDTPFYYKNIKIIY